MGHTHNFQSSGWGCQILPWSWDSRSRLIGISQGGRYRRGVSSENQVWEGQNGAMRRRRAPLTFTLHRTAGISFTGGKRTDLHSTTDGRMHLCPESSGDSSQTEVCSRTELCGEPKAIPPGRRSHSWMKCDRGSRVLCWGRHTWLGVSRRPGRSDALHHKGKPRASLFGMMESEALDWKMAGTGSVRCRREPIVFPNTWSAGGKRTDCRGGKPNASPNCQTEEKWWWTLSVHQTSRGGCDRSEWGERVWGGQIRFCRWTGEFARMCSGEKRRGLSAHSPSPRARHPNPRSRTHGGPRDGEKRMTLFRTPQAEGSEMEILKKFTFWNPINRLACMRKPQTFNTLTVRVIARDKSSTRRLTTAIFHGTSPRGKQSSAVCSRRSANGESVSEKLYWARKIATEGQYGHFVKAEKSEE